MCQQLVYKWRWSTRTKISTNTHHCRPVRLIVLPWLTAGLWREAGRCTLHCPISVCCWLPRGLVVSNVVVHNALGPNGGGFGDQLVWQSRCGLSKSLFFYFLPRTGHQHRDEQTQRGLKQPQRGWEKREREQFVWRLSVIQVLQVLVVFSSSVEDNWTSRCFSSHPTFFFTSNFVWQSQNLNL